MVVGGFVIVNSPIASSLIHQLFLVRLLRDAPVDAQRVLHHALGAEALARAGESRRAQLLPQPAILQQPDDGRCECALVTAAGPADR